MTAVAGGCYAALSGHTVQRCSVSAFASACLHEPYAANEAGMHCAREMSCEWRCRDVFSAGASHYGVADLGLLAQETHKFESR